MIVTKLVERWGRSASASAGTIALPLSGRAAKSSAFASTIASSVPSSSRWTGPTLVITPISGSAIPQSSAICPRPRIAISSTSASVWGGALRIVKGRPISVLKFCGLA